MGTVGEMKENFRSIYDLAKQLDEQRKAVATSSNLFEADLLENRKNLINKCEYLLFNNYETIGKKSREILWRKGYYDYIAIIKKLWSKEQKNGKNVQREKLYDLIFEGISQYKNIAIKMENIFELDLKYLLDFSILKTDNNQLDMNNTTNITINDKSLVAVSYALDTIHSALLSLGDLHRYYIDFKLDGPIEINRKMAGRFYFEAFKLNPTIGMAQNQLGTLYYGQNNDLDSIYHYLYSLICTVPFELSENNVCKLLLGHVDYLEDLDPDKVEFSLRDFYARFFLIVDIFFFDKDVPDFNSLCHCVLIDLRKILCSQNIKITDENLFKIVAILLFCMSKLKMINSQKVHSLNAFLVAVCSDLIDACIVNLEQYILINAKQNLEFQESYTEKFTIFEGIVRKSRDDYKAIYEKNTTNDKIIMNGIKKSGTTDSDGSKSQKFESGIKIEEKLTRSSDEAKESDLKTPLSTKSKKRNLKLRRRRKKVQESDESSCYDSDSNLDTDFSSNDEQDDDCTDLSSNFDSDFSDIDDKKMDKKLKSNIEKKLPETSDLEEMKSIEGIQIYSDGEDIVIEEENIIYPGENVSEDYINFDVEQIDKFVDNIVESFTELNMNDLLEFKSDNEDENRKKIIQNDITINNLPIINDDSDKMDKNPLNLEPIKLKYKNKYMKIDPNIIIEFAQTEPTMKCLKVLFDWLRNNNEILFGCFHTNPEFIHKIMKLLNYCNIDIFTRKVYFERDLIKTPMVRKNLDELFNVRSTIPLNEDILLRNFDLLKNIQLTFDWEIPIHDNITTNEENILRIFKMVDFGFFICKLKKFNYNFCPKTRRFTEDMKKKREKKKQSTRRRERPPQINKNNHRRRGLNDINGKSSSRRYNNNNNNNGRCGSSCDRRTNSHKSYTSNEEKDTVEESKPAPPVSGLRKGYLKNRNQIVPTTEKTNTSSGADDEKTDVPTIDRKCEIMGKLWLKSEVDLLESKYKKKPFNVILTPYMVVDAKSLTEYTGIVKNLVKSKKFVVLIPNVVLCELDELKKHSERARNVIRWLEHEFRRGNRHLRSQRDNETLTLSLLKIPKKLDHESYVFFQIAQFCNFIVVNHSDDNEMDSNVLTFLTGDHLNDKKFTNFCYTGILDTIPIRYDQIVSFYDKYKKK